jgi:hypothetical protein
VTNRIVLTKGLFQTTSPSHPGSSEPTEYKLPLCIQLVQTLAQARTFYERALEMAPDFPEKIGSAEILGVAVLSDGLQRVVTEKRPSVEQKNFTSNAGVAGVRTGSGRLSPRVLRRERSFLTLNGRVVHRTDAPNLQLCTSAQTHAAAGCAADANWSNASTACAAYITLGPAPM